MIPIPDRPWRLEPDWLTRMRRQRLHRFLAASLFALMAVATPVFLFVRHHTLQRDFAGAEILDDVRVTSVDVHHSRKSSRSTIEVTYSDPEGNRRTGHFDLKGNQSTRTGRPFTSELRRTADGDLISTLHVDDAATERWIGLAMGLVILVVSGVFIREGRRAGMVLSRHVELGESSRAAVATVLSVKEWAVRGRRRGGRSARRTRRIQFTLDGRQSDPAKQTHIDDAATELALVGRNRTRLVVLVDPADSEKALPLARDLAPFVVDPAARKAFQGWLEAAGDRDDREIAADGGLH